MSGSKRKETAFANNIKSRNFYLHFDKAGRYAIHRLQVDLQASENGTLISAKNYPNSNILPKELSKFKYPTPESIMLH